MKRSEVIKISAMIVSGILANPVSGAMVLDSWQRQQLFQQVTQETINTFLNIGVPITEDES